MAISSTTTSASFAGNGSATVFATGFKFASNADLVVTRWLGAVATLLVLGTDYTVSGAGSDSGGTVTCTTAPASGTTLVISRSTPKTQPTSFGILGEFSPKVHENAFDRATMIAQEAGATSTSNAAAIAALQAEDVTQDSRLTSVEGRATSLETSRTTDEANIATNTAGITSLNDEIATLTVENQFSAVVHTTSVGGQRQLVTGGIPMVVNGSAPQDGLVHSYRVAVTTGGAVSGGAQFAWNVDNGAASSPIAASALPTQLGTTGVYVSWYPGGTLTLSDSYEFTSNPIPAPVAVKDQVNTFTAANTFNGGIVVTTDNPFGGGVSASGGAGFDGVFGQGGAGGSGHNNGIYGSASGNGTGVRGEGGSGSGTGGYFLGGSNVASGGIGVFALGYGSSPDIQAAGNGVKFPDNSIQTKAAAPPTSTTALTANTGWSFTTAKYWQDATGLMHLVAVGSVTSASPNLNPFTGTLAAGLRPSESLPGKAARASSGAAIGSGGAVSLVLGIISDGTFTLPNVSNGDSIWINATWQAGQ